MRLPPARVLNITGMIRPMATRANGAFGPVEFERQRESFQNATRSAQTRDGRSALGRWPTPS